MLRTVEASLHALGPRQILERGYAIVRLKDGPVVSSVAKVAVGDEITVTVADGSLDAEAREVRSEGV